MSDVTFDCPDLTTFARLDELGLEVVGQRVDRDRAVLACRVGYRDLDMLRGISRLGPVPAGAVIG